MFFICEYIEKIKIDTSNNNIVIPKIEAKGLGFTTSIVWITLEFFSNLCISINKSHIPVSVKTRSISYSFRLNGSNPDKFVNVNGPIISEVSLWFNFIVTFASFTKAWVVLSLTIITICPIPFCKGSGDIPNNISYDSVFFVI